MSRVDELYIEKAKDILENGYSEKDAGVEVRPYWDDKGTKVSAYTKYLTQQFVEYKEGEVPIINLRKIAWKTAIKELLWIYQDKSNDVSVLKEKYNVHYWDSWQNEEGNLGTAYGYQLAKEIKSPENGEYITQIDRLISELKNNPLNRRLILNLMDMDDLADMTLIPCAFMTIWSVRGKYLDMTLIQRSGDYLAAAGPGNINSFQYYVLMRMIAQVTGFEPGRMVHFVQNLHIYDRHVDIIKEVIENDATKEGPVLELNPEIKDFYDFKIEDFDLKNYDPGTTKYQIPIAI